MATYFLSIHDLRLVSSQTEDTEECWPLDEDSDQFDSDNNEERDVADSWPLDADSDQLDHEDDEGRDAADSWPLDRDGDRKNIDNDNEKEPRDVDRSKIAGKSESCPDTQTKR